MWRIRYTEPGGARRSETVRGTRREADDRLAALRAARGGAPASRVTVGQAYERWFLPELEERLGRGDLAAGYVKSLACAWNAHVGPRWADVPAASVDALGVEDWVRGLSRNVAVRCRVVMRGTLAKCQRRGIVASNVMDLEYRADGEVRARDRGTYTLAEMGEALRAVAGTGIEGAVVLAGFAGLRVGEALAVRAPEVRLSGHAGVPVAVVPVERQVVAHSREVSTRLKNPQSRRTAVVPGPVGEYLARLATDAPCEWLTDDALGGPLGHGALNRVWAGALARAGVVRHPFQNLRNSWETAMHWELGVDPLMIEPMMGHAGASVTARHYDRPREADFVRVAAEAYAAHPYADAWDFLGHDPKN